MMNREPGGHELPMRSSLTVRSPTWAISDWASGPREEWDEASA